MVLGQRPGLQQAVGCRKAGLGRGTCSGIKWLSMAILGSTWPWLPWGLFALREERQQGFCRLWAGAGSRELLSWLRSVVERPSGPAEVRVNPWFSSTGRYCTEQEEVPIRKEGNQASFFFLPFFTLQGLWVSSRTGPVLGEPEWLLHFH